MSASSCSPFDASRMALVAEGGEDGRRVQRQLDALAAELAHGAGLLAHAGADADGLADLVDQAPPERSGLVSEHHEAPGIRAHVDHRDPLHHWR
jgi:hypothetical protein